MIKTSVRPIKLKAARNSVGNKLLILCLPSSMPNLLMRQQQGILNFGPEVLSFLGILRIGYTAVPEDLKKWAGTFCLHLPHGRDESTQNCPSPLPVQHPATDLQFYSPALGL